MFEPGMFEYGLKTGDLPEKEMIKIFEKALSKISGEINDSRIARKPKMRKNTGPFGRSTPGAEPPEYDHVYFYNYNPNLFLQLYPNRETNGRVKFPDEGIIWNLYVCLLDIDYPPKLSEDDQIQEFGSRVMEELFRTLPCEKVLIKKYKPGENRL